MAYREFSLNTNNEPVSFRLGDQMFMCRPQIAAGVMLKFGRLMASESEDEGSQGLKMLDAVMDFFQAALMPTDYGRFMATIEDPDIAVPLEVLVDIAGWLGGIYSGDRPTGKSFPQQSDKLSSGDDSTVGASVETPTYSRSLPTEPTT